MKTNYGYSSFFIMRTNTYTLQPITLPNSIQVMGTCLTTLGNASTDNSQQI